MASEVLLKAGDARACRAGGKLLAGDLKDQRPKGTERREPVEPGARVEVRLPIDHPREHRIRLPRKAAGRGIGEGRGDHQTFIPPSTTMSMPVT
jgi:hypothetical protein